MVTATLSAIGTVVPLADGWHHGWGGPWFLFFPLFWILVIGGIIWLVRGRPPWRRMQLHAPRSESGIDVLERRFAEGSLSPDEYRERRAILEERRPHGDD